MNPASEKLLQLVAENPELDVMPLVAEDASSGDYGWCVGSFGRASVEEYVFGSDYTSIGLDDERIYLRSEDEDDMYDSLSDHKDNADKTDREIFKMVESLAWKKAIFVRIGAQ